jgi:hypothetical protein
MPTVDLRIEEGKQDADRAAGQAGGGFAKTS